MKVVFLLLACLWISRANVLRGTTSFATRLYNVLPDKDKNLIFSPLSVHWVLSLAYQGAVGETAESLSRSLNVPNANNTAEEYEDILKVLNANNSVTVEAINKIYIHHKFELNNNFKEVAEVYFSAEADSIDFSQKEETADTINEWVRNKTHDKIDNLVSNDDFSEKTRFVILNAIYFKGAWLEQFSKSFTRKEKFYISETDTVDCDMMIQTHTTYYYAENQELDAKLVKLPYTDNRFSMVIILPNKITGVDELEKKLSSTDINSLFNSVYPGCIDLYFPKFKIESQIDLKDPLIDTMKSKKAIHTASCGLVYCKMLGWDRKKVGLSKIFGNDAEFPNMIDSSGVLKVDKIVQKAFIEVNEDGSEAAATTDMDITFVSALKTSPPIFKVDHPYMFYLVLRMNDVNVIIFSGKVNNPSV